MLDILDIINDATKEANSFENHAAKNLSLEERLLYLQGLALVMNADGEIHPEEKEYIRILIKSFEMDEAILDSFVEFAQRPDKDTVQAFFRTFRRRPIAQLFLFDALMMTRRDDSIDEKEKAVVDKIAEQLEVLKGTYQDIYDLFCHIKNKDWEESSLYFSSHLLNSEYFKHLLDYYEVEHKSLLTSTAELRKDRLIRIIKDRLNFVVKEKEINLEITTSIVAPMLQSMLDRGEISIISGSILFKDESEVKFTDLGIEYDSENKALYCVNDVIITSDVIKDIFLCCLNLSTNKDYKILLDGLNDKIIFGNVSVENNCILDTDKPAQVGYFLVFNGDLWLCDEGQYGYDGSNNLYNRSGKFSDELSKNESEIALHYNLGDGDIRGVLRKVSLL
ncbi:TerB family tellurite resistance protein [Vibrio vulnificus]|nr:TerB family tellurite resistance protein [Vibrio vulnificus]